ncbi:MAG: hypothetical protein RL653_3953 [Pseudomonadota bacterium]|jgi:NADH dehydrogenase
MAPGKTRRVVVVGGGFAGLAAAKRLARDKRLHVALVDQRNHHLFQPLLYQVATAGLSPSEIALPIRSQFRDAPRVEVYLGEVQRVDVEARTVFGPQLNPQRYDYLVLACGAQHSYFGHPEWEPFAPGLKTVEQATEIRRRILMAFELAENLTEPERVRALLTFIVVGGGPTGVELAGAIADIARTVLVDDFRHIDPSLARVVLLEAGPRILPTFDERLARRASEDLTALGVTVRTRARVTGVDADGVQLGDERLPARTVLWAAGVEAARLGRTLGIPLDRAGRVPVREDLSLEGRPEIFVAGDMASVQGPQGPIPGVAPAALQMGRAVARNILADLDGRARVPFRYVDKGSMATVGKHRAIAQVGSVRMGGYVAWVAWLFVHVFYLVGFRRRVRVFADWTWSYLFSRRGARLITQKDWRTS